MVAKLIRILGMIRHRRRRRLSAADQQALEVLQLEQVDDTAKRRSNFITDENLRSGRDLYCDTAAMVFDILSENKIDTAVNVGARVDVICSYLALKFPNARFVSVDFQRISKHTTASYSKVQTGNYVQVMLWRCLKMVSAQMLSFSLRQLAC